MRPARFVDGVLSHCFVVTFCVTPSLLRPLPLAGQTLFRGKSRAFKLQTVKSYNRSQLPAARDTAQGRPSATARRARGGKGRRMGHWPPLSGRTCFPCPTRVSWAEVCVCAEHAQTGGLLRTGSLPPAVPTDRIEGRGTPAGRGRPRTRALGRPHAPEGPTTARGDRRRHAAGGEPRAGEAEKGATRAGCPRKRSWGRIARKDSPWRHLKSKSKKHWACMVFFLFSEAPASNR